MSYHADTATAVRLLWEHLDQLRDAVDGGYTGTALYKVADLRDQLTEVATELVEDAIRDGMSQAEIARRMDVPPSVLRGAKREFSA